jgi:hypothetical protein
MARPYKQGLIYFPLDIDYYEDDKLVELTLEFGLIGEIVYLRLLTMIYAEGYFIERSIASLARSILRSVGLRWIPNIEVIEDVIRACGKLDLIDPSLLEMGIITSRAIQRQFVLSTKRRRKIDTSKYWLLSEEDIRVIADNNGVIVVSGDNNPDNVGINEVNADASTQSKSKSNIDIKDKYLDKSARGAPVLNYLTKCLIEAKYVSEYSLDLSLYDELFTNLVDNFGFENVRIVTRYITKAVRHNGSEIDNRFDYFKAAAIKNLESYAKSEVRVSESFEEWVKRRILSVDR